MGLKLKRVYENKKNDNKTGIMQVLIEIKQKCFNQQLALN